MRAEAPEPSIRGSYINPSKGWIIKTYGQEVFRQAVTTLPAAERDIYLAELVSLAWYPLRQWTAILASVRTQVKARTGEDEHTFDRRHLYGSISGTMQTIYRLAFVLLSPTTVVAKVTPVFKRVYSHGEYEVLENDLGRCLIRFSHAPIEMLPEIERSFPLATSWMLDVAGQKVTEHRLSPRVIGDTFSADLELRYSPKSAR